MTVQDLDRQKVGKLVSHLFLDPDFANFFTITDDDGNRVVVPALEEDTLRFVAKLVQRIGGAATLVAVGRGDEDGSLRLGLAELHILKASAHSEDHHLPAGHKTTVGDLFRVLTPGTSITYRLAEDDELKVQELIEGPAPEESAGLAGLET